MSKKYITGCMLSLMIVMGLAVGTLPRTAAAEESQVQDSGAEHVLKEENNWDMKALTRRKKMRKTNWKKLVSRRSLAPNG